MRKRYMGMLNHLSPDNPLWMVPGARHVRCYDIGPEEYVRRVAEFFGPRPEVGAVQPMHDAVGREETAER